MLHKKTIIVIVGPTASGKTSIAIELAKHFATKIVSADSRQCFKETSIGVAKPTVQELHEIEHFFINSHSIFETVSAGIYEKFAIEKLNLIFEHNDIAIVVGGTGLYIKALCEGLDEVPATDKKIMDEIVDNYEKNGLTWLQQQVKQHDEVFWQLGEQLNPHRLMRALAVKLSTNKSIVSYQKNDSKERLFNIIKIGLAIDKQQLHYNINTRVDLMIKDGLIDEAKALHNYKTLNALQTVGYKELFDYFEGKHDLQKAKELIKTHTRQYAKRQLTWFRKDGNVNWMPQPHIHNCLLHLHKLGL